jgi:hypothetical protein
MVQANAVSAFNALPVDPLQSLLCGGECGKAADEGDVRIVAQLQGEL